MKIVLSLSSLMMCLFFMLTTHTAQAQCISGVEIRSNDGIASSTFICKDGSPDFLSFRAARAGKLYGYAVVDTRSNRVKILTTNATIDFDKLGVGIYRVYGVNYAGALVAPGRLITQTLGTICSEVSPNFITVTVTIPDAGQVLLPSGADEINVCVGPHKEATVVFSNDRGVLGGLDVPAQYAYLVTNEFDVIIGVSTSNEVNFSNAGAGECRVYGFAYTGDLAIGLNTDLDWAMSTACADVSGNYITVNRTFTNVDGGNVRTAAGETTVYSCPGDGNEDAILFTSDASGDHVTYAVTDANGNILIAAENGFFNFEGAGVGACRVYALAYEGELADNLNGMNINSSALASGCADISENFVTVVRDVPEAGVVQSDEGTIVQVCIAGDGIADIIEVDVFGASTTIPNYIYVVTDANRRILTTSTGDVFNFDGAGAGDCRIYGLSYTGVFNDDARFITDALSTDCFDLSDNFILVERTVLDAGSVSPAAAAVQLSNGTATIGAVTGIGSIVPPLYEVAYILTSGDELTIEQINFEKPQFTVTEAGDYRIHTFVGELNVPYERSFVHLSTLIGESAASVIRSIQQNNICADIDATGALIRVLPESFLQVDPGVNVSSQMNIYPNPATAAINFSYVLPVVTDQYTNIRIFNFLGTTVISEFFEDVAGINTNRVNISRLPTGTYTVWVSNGNEVRTGSFIKQ